MFGISISVRCYYLCFIPPIVVSQLSITYVNKFQVHSLCLYVATDALDHRSFHWITTPL